MADPKLRRRCSRNDRIWEWKSAKEFQKRGRRRKGGRQPVYVLKQSQKAEPQRQEVNEVDWCFSFHATTKYPTSAFFPTLPLIVDKGFVACSNDMTALTVPAS